LEIREKQEMQISGYSVRADTLRHCDCNHWHLADLFETGRSQAGPKMESGNCAP
jgi:hypothetical protein